MKKTFLFLLIGITAAWSGSAQPLQPSHAVATCFSGATPSSDVIAILDLGSPSTQGAVINQNWNPSRGAHWPLSDLGTEVFGIALDDAPSPKIYVTSTTVYNNPGTAASGRVYRLDPANPQYGSSNAASKVFATLPNTGQGLGNIAYDQKNKQFFVSNFYDGKIYRLNSAGVVQPNPLDPGAPFVGPAPAPLSERVWGVGVFQDRLYFGTWSPGQVYSIAIDPTTGGFSGPIDAQGLLPNPTVMPIADIEFSKTGKMLIAERGMSGVMTVPHQARIFEFSGGGPWVSSGSNFSIGVVAGGTNAAGGVDYNCALEGAGAVVATGDALHLTANDQIYGLQLFPPSGGSIANSYLVDLDGDTISQDKTLIGDVDVYKTCDRDCGELTGVKVLCKTDGSGDFTVQFQVKNLSSSPVYHAFLVNLPNGVTATPNHFTFTNGLATGAVSQVLQTTIHGAQPGQQLTFELTVHDQELNECCAVRQTITLPRCDCAQVLKESGPSCLFGLPQKYKYTFSLQNLFPQTPGYVFIVPTSPTTASLSPNVISYTGSPQNISLTIGNVSPGQQVCFLVSLHTSDFEECCSIRRCVTLPRCVLDPPIPIDGTAVTFDPEGLLLEEPGRTPGVRIPLAAGTTAFDTAWREEDAAALPVGGTLEQSIEGLVGEGEARTVARLVTTRTGEGAELRASFPGLSATSHRFELYLKGERVSVLSGVPGDAPAICNCGPKITKDAHFTVLQHTPASQEGPPACDGTGPRCLFAGFTFPDARPFLLPGLTTFQQADEVRVYPEGDTGSAVRSLTAANIKAQGLTRLTLTDFNTDQDCNGNGVSDYDEITRGGGLDLDRDGVLDVCAAPAPLSVSLATGFDQAASATLPARANDDDWRLVANGTSHPAVVIARPNRSWPAPFPSSQWVGAEPERGASAPGVSTYTFERCFCLAEGARDVALDLRLLADDDAQVLLNGQALSTGGGFRGSPLQVKRTGQAGDGLFTAGTNCLRVEVRDPNAVVTGLLLDGLVTSPAGTCR